MIKHIHRLRGIVIAFAALALSAGLAFGAQPTSTGLANAAAHSGKTVPVRGADQQTAGDEDADENADEDADETADESTDESAEKDAESNESTDSGDNCTTDPTALTPEELAQMRHGSIVCWAAQQTTWPEWFSNHGAFVKCWAHTGKADAINCAEDPAAQAPTASGASTGHGHAKNKNKSQGHGHNQ